VKLTNTLAFMFETRFRQRVSKYAAELDTLQRITSIAGAA
jgi:homogentisate 1,2-dioxygenase